MRRGHAQESRPPRGRRVESAPSARAGRLLQAAQKLGLEDRVKAWACSTPCNNDFVAKALGPKWNRKFFVNAELTPPSTADGHEMQLYKAILAKYGGSVSGGIGTFSQMRFLDAEMAASALQKVKGPYTLKSVNAAIKAIKNYKTEQLCKPFTYGDYPEHIPNNTDYTVTPDNGVMAIAQGARRSPRATPRSPPTTRSPAKQQPYD